jgi:hypothetical protein
MVDIKGPDKDTPRYPVDLKNPEVAEQDTRPDYEKMYGDFQDGDYLPEWDKQKSKTELSVEDAASVLKSQGEHRVTTNPAPGVQNPSHIHDHEAREKLSNAYRITLAGNKARADSFGLVAQMTEKYGPDGVVFIEHDEKKLLSLLRGSDQEDNRPNIEQGPAPSQSSETEVPKTPVAPVDVKEALVQEQKKTDK